MRRMTPQQAERRRKEKEEREQKAAERKAWKRKHDPSKAIYKEWVTELKEEIEQKDERIKKLEKIAEAPEKHLKKKHDEVVKKLKEEIAYQDARLAGCKEELEQKDEKIDELEEIAGKAPREAHKELVASKAEIEDLKKRLAASEAERKRLLKAGLDGLLGDGSAAEKVGKVEAVYGI